MKEEGSRGRCMRCAGYEWGEGGGVVRGWGEVLVPRCAGKGKYAYRWPEHSGTDVFWVTFALTVKGVGVRPGSFAALRPQTKVSCPPLLVPPLIGPSGIVQATKK